MAERNRRTVLVATLVLLWLAIVLAVIVVQELRQARAHLSAGPVSMVIYPFAPDVWLVPTPTARLA
jgi:hypothetical protein